MGVVDVLPVRDSGRDSKLVALRKCPERAEFDELEDGRGELLVFTEHHDTLNHLREHLDSSSTVSPEVRRPGSNKINTLGGDSGRRCL